MESRYDLFELAPDRFPEWVASANNIAEARKKMESLPEPAIGGQYLIRDFCSGNIVAYTVSSRAPSAGSRAVVVART